MASFVSYLLLALAVLLAIPVTVLLIEILAALSLPQRQLLLNLANETRQRVTVLVPAHNESAGILPTLEDIKIQMLAGDRLLVIADNCIDDTAAVAKATGAEVIERNDAKKRGKGHALDYGLKHVSLDPPAIVMIIDADCRLKSGAIDHLAKMCAKTKRPVQALDLMIAPKELSINFRVAEFAWRVKNWVRPLGLATLNLPCQLMGTGMAIPWSLIRSVNLASGSIVEDLKLGFDLALSGNPPLFCPSATVISYFPSSVDGAKTQRNRWEQGHIDLILTSVPRYIYHAVAKGNLGLLALALDLAVPPLSLLAILLAALFFVNLFAALFGFSSAALVITAICCVAFIIAMFASWLAYGRDILEPSSLISIASYIFAKLPLYRRSLSGRPTQSWTRTDRKKDE